MDIAANDVRLRGGIALFVMLAISCYSNLGLVPLGGRFCNIARYTKMRCVGEVRIRVKRNESQRGKYPMSP